MLSALNNTQGAVATIACVLENPQLQEAAYIARVCASAYEHSSTFVAVKSNDRVDWA